MPGGVPRTMAPKRQRSSQEQSSAWVKCPACQKTVTTYFINSHLDGECIALRGALETSTISRTEHSESGGDAELNVSRVSSLSGASCRYKLEFNQDYTIHAHEARETSNTVNQRTFQKESSLENSSCHKVFSEVVFPPTEDLPVEHHLNVSPVMSIPCHPKLLVPVPTFQGLKGHSIVEDFISVEEEERLLNYLDNDLNNPWKLSRFNGRHLGKAYGVVTDLKKGVVLPARIGMPKFIMPFVERMRIHVPALKDFLPNEINSIDYCKVDGHYLEAHVDNRQLSGAKLVNLSLQGSCYMTYQRERSSSLPFRVLLRLRSLQIVTGESRFNFTHAITNQDLLDPRRVSITFRQSVEPRIS